MTGIILSASGRVWRSVCSEDGEGGWTGCSWTYSPGGELVGTQRSEGSEGGLCGGCGRLGGSSVTGCRVHPVANGWSAAGKSGHLD